MSSKKCTQCGATIEALFGLGLCNGCFEGLNRTSRVDVFETPFQRDMEERMASPEFAKAYVEARTESPTQEKIRRVCDEIRDLLLEKNRAYGDSAINPVRVFSKASPEEQLLVRIDDKLSRISRGHALDEDVVLDLIGYLVLLRVARTA